MVYVPPYGQDAADSKGDSQAGVDVILRDAVSNTRVVWAKWILRSAMNKQAHFLETCQVWFHNEAESEWSIVYFSNNGQALDIKLTVLPASKWKSGRRGWHQACQQLLRCRGMLLSVSLETPLQAWCTWWRWHQNSVLHSSINEPETNVSFESRKWVHRFTVVLSYLKKERQPVDENVERGNLFKPSKRCTWARYAIWNGFN